MSMTRLKIFEGDSPEIVEQKVNHFIELYAYAVERIHVYPKKEDGNHTGGYYCYITYREKFKERGDQNNVEEKD